MNFDKVLKALLEGTPVIITDNHDRENEGDVVIAAEKASNKNINFFIQEAHGLMCVPAHGQILDNLKIPMMVQDSTDKFRTPFTVSVDAAHGIASGMSVSDRLKTLAVMTNFGSDPEDLSRPGHLFPLRANDKLLLGRQGHTESSIELMRLADLKEIAVIAEILTVDGTMARGQELTDFAMSHNLPTITVDEIYKLVYLK